MGKSTISMVIFNSKLLVYQRVPSNCRSSTDFLQKGNYFDNLTTQSPKLFEMESVHWQIKVDSQQQTSWLSSKCPLCHLVGWWLNIQRKPWLVGGFNLSKKYESQLGWLFSIYGKIKNVPNHQPDGDMTNKEWVFHCTLSRANQPRWGNNSQHHCVAWRTNGDWPYLGLAEMNSELLQDSNFCWCQVPKPWQWTWINMFSKVSTMWGPQTL